MRPALGALLVLAMYGVTWAGGGSDAAPVPYADEADTRASYQIEASNAERMLERAYELTSDEKEQLRTELTRLVEAQTKYDVFIRTAARDSQAQLQAAIEKNGPEWTPNEDELKRFMLPLTEAYAKAPFSLEKAQAFVESKLPTERAKAGRARMDTVGVDEAWKEYDEKNAATLQGVVHNAQVRDEFNAHRQADAELSPAGNPMPKAEFVPPAPPAPKPDAVRVQPPEAPRPAPAPPKSKPALPETPRQEPAARVEPPTPPPPPLQPAPPVDEWDRHVDAVAQKYKFTSDQKSKGQGILKDLRDRARQYRKSHSADFEAASRMQPGADRVAEEKRLSQPLDELFAELKERLEHLPTQDQRDAAGVKPKK